VLTPNADDIGKADFRTIGVVDALEGVVFGVRQPVEADAVLLGIRLSAVEARGALGFLFGEIRMRLDQCQNAIRQARDRRPPSSPRTTG